VKHFRLFYLGGWAMEIPAMVILVLFTFHPVTTHTSISIAPGFDAYGSLEVDLNGGGPISGTFESVSGNDILFMLLDEDQFADYSANISHSSRFSAISSSGSFSIEQVDMERCYLVAEHATTFSNTEEVQVTYELSETNIDYLFLSMTLIIVGGILVMYAFYKRNKEKVEARISTSKYLDVVFFDEEPKRP